MPPLLVISLVAALILLCLVAVWLALRARRTTRPLRPPEPRPAKGASPPASAAGAAISRDEAQELLQNARDMVRADPARAAQTMRRWLSDSDS